MIQEGKSRDKSLNSLFSFSFFRYAKAMSDKNLPPNRAQHSHSNKHIKFFQEGIYWPKRCRGMGRSRDIIFPTMHNINIEQRISRESPPCCAFVSSSIEWGYCVLKTLQGHCKKHGATRKTAIVTKFAKIYMSLWYVFLLQKNFIQDKVTGPKKRIGNDLICSPDV